MPHALSVDRNAVVCASNFQFEHDKIYLNAKLPQRKKKPRENKKKLNRFTS